MKKLLLAILLCIAVTMFLAACGENSTNVSTDSNNNTSATEEGQINDDKKTDFVNTAEQTTIFPGTWTVGSDLKAGKYIFSANSGMGNFFIYNTSGYPIINDILTSSTEDSFGMGVTKIQAYVVDGYTIEVSGLNEVMCKPADSELKTTLIAGMHVVGWDITEGSYIVTGNGNSGNFFVYDKNGTPTVNEIISNDSMGLGVEKVKVKLKDGYIIGISGIESLSFTAQ